MGIYMLEKYCYQGNQKLRMGYTTGSCSAAAAMAATHWLLMGEPLETVSLMTPAGIRLKLDIISDRRQENLAVCGVKKDAGDDADVTDGMMIYASARRVSGEAGSVIIDGGPGVGRVTKRGLDQPVGSAAINSVPRKMISQAVSEVINRTDYTGAVEILISIPGGEEVAKKTFNPELGIAGGLSVLGTSGIVEPMSEKALVDTIHVRMKMLKETGRKHYLVTPGNYGMDYLKKEMGLDIKDAVKCSNFLGETIDMAYEFQAESMLIVGHIGKLSKLACGIMNTHSRYGDGRMEAFVAAGVRCGAENSLLKRILDCVTTDEVIELLLQEQCLERFMAQIMEQIEKYVTRRACDGLSIGVITFSNRYGKLGETSTVKEMMQWYIS